MSEPMGAVKNDQGKARLSLFPMLAFRLAGKVFTFGAKKYAAYNWARGLPHSRLMDAALRHLTDYWMGEDLDPESGEPHLAHALCCVAMLLESKTRGLGTDDRHDWMPYHDDRRQDEPGNGAVDTAGASDTRRPPDALPIMREPLQDA